MKPIEDGCVVRACENLQGSDLDRWVSGVRRSQPLDALDLAFFGERRTLLGSMLTGLMVLGLFGAIALTFVGFASHATSFLP